MVLKWLVLVGGLCSNHWEKGSFSVLFTGICIQPRTGLILISMETDNRGIQEHAEGTWSLSPLRERQSCKQHMHLMKALGTGGHI